MRALSPFQSFVLRLLAAVMALAMFAGPWMASARPAAAAGLPDLTVESVTTSPADPAVGDSVSVIIRVKNIGDSASGSCYVTGEMDGIIKTNQTIPALPVGMTSTISYNWVVTPGNHVATATADSTGIITESNETNNEASYTFTPRAPDLTISSITWTPQSPTLRQEVLFTLHIANTGTATSPATRAEFFIDSKSSGYQDVPGLGPGQTTDIVYPWYADPGQHLMKGVVDPDNNVVENNENNNSSSLTFTMALPDLVVNQIIQDPVEYSSGDTVSLTAEITNQGNGNAEASQTAFFINDAALATLNCPALAAGASVNLTTTWKAVDGTNSVKVVADYYHVITESDENNNEATAQLGTVPADLTVSGITWTPTEIGAGDTVTIQATIKNQGAGRAAASRAVYQVGYGAAQILQVPAIDAGASYVATFTWTAIAGSWDVQFSADYDNGIQETTYSNNSATAKITVTPPDLTVSAISWTPLHPDHGNPVTFNITVTNVGNGTATPSYLGCYIDDQLVYNTLVTTLAGGQSVNMTYTWTAVNGYHTFTATADFKKEVNEVNENNNSRSVVILANMPDLVIDSVTWTPVDLPAGQTATFNVKVHNIGSQPTPLTRLAYSVDGVTAGFVDVPPLLPDGAATEALTWPISSGQHTIQFVADATNLVDEINEENNTKILTLPLPDLVVTDLTASPATPVIGDTVTVTVTLKNEGQSATQATVLGGSLDNATPMKVQVAPVAPGATVTKTFQYTATGGDHTFSVTADLTNTTIESDETNNFKSLEITTRMPDLAVSDLSWRMENPLVSNTTDLSANITNAGAVAAPATTLSYQIDNGTAANSPVPALGPGESYLFTLSKDLPPAPHTFTVTVDPDNAIVESDETNNTANLTFNSKAPDLDIKGITWTPVIAAVGDNVTISVNLENRGTVAADGATVTLSVDGKDVGTQTAKTLAVGDTTTLTFPWKLTTLQPVFTAMADYNGTILESDETNNSMTSNATFTAPAPTTKKPTLPIDLTTPQNASFIQSYWWAMMLVAALIGAGVFFVLFRAFRKDK